MIKIKKHSENVFSTFGKLYMFMRNNGRTDQEASEYIDELQKLSYDEWTEKVSKDFEGKFEIK